MENIFLTEEELNKLKQLQKQEGEIVTRLGEIEYQIQVLQSQKENEAAKIFTNRQEGDMLAQQLQEKYGEGGINMETGYFIKS
jgi:TolA-binding protein